jgi:hypothetical protein
MIDPPTTALEATVFRKLTLAAAAGAGYVLGAKAGKERYTQIEAKFREIAGMPAVQNATAAVKDTASGVAESAKSTVTEKTSGSSSSPSTSTPDVVVDLGTGASAQPVTASPATSSGLGSSTSSTTTTAPMTGASASATAPDITRL